MAQKRKKTRRKNNGIVLSEHVIGAIYILFAVLGFVVKCFAFVRRRYL